MPQIVVEECPADGSDPLRELGKSRSPEVAACLDSCSSALALADKRMTRLADTARRISGGSSLASSPDPKPSMSGRTRQCHGCHGPCDASHKGHPTGADRCTLEHDDRCEGGITSGFDRAERKWRACPRGYVLMDDVYYDDEYYDDHTGGDDDNIEPVKKTVEPDVLSRELLSLSLVSRPTATASSSLGSFGSAIVSSLGSAITSNTTVSGPQVTVCTALGGSAQTTTTSSGLGTAPTVQEGSSVSDQVLEARQRVVALRKKREELELLAELQKEEELVAAQTRQLQQQLGHNRGRPKIGEAAGLLRGRNQVSDSQVDDRGFYGGPTIGQIRSVSGLAPVVESRVNCVRSEVPSLARRPNAALGGLPSGGGGIRTRSLSGARQRSFDPIRIQRPAQGHSYVEDLIVIDDNAAQPSTVFKKQNIQSRRPQKDLLTTDPETDPSDEEDVGQQLRLVYRRDQDGNRYRVWEPVEDASPVYEWVTDVRTGRQYKQLVQSDHIRADQRSRSAGHRSSLQQQTIHERSPTFVSVSKAEKEGKSESIVEWARKCPVLWAEKVNHENMNAIVWLWGYLSEILDAKTAVVGAPPLESGVLEAKLQHALCVLEVCASHSEKTDFDNHGLKIAKLYARKVQAQLDRGLVSWLDFSEFKANPHPSELIAAKQELEQKVRKKVPEIPKTDRSLCSTWNTSKTEGKCDWQTRNPDKGKCNRKHNCSYCIEKGLGNQFHQRSFCGKRIAAGDT